MAAAQEALQQNLVVFDRLDRNKDGQLNQSEFAALTNPYAIKIDPNSLMSLFDTDRNGQVTLIEYRIATQSSFDRIDGDRNGVVTALELRASGISP